MFDDVFSMTMLCSGNFREGVRDPFGASIVEDVLDPISKEVDSLRVFNSDFQQQSLNIDRTLAEARAIQFMVG